MKHLLSIILFFFIVITKSQTPEVKEKYESGDSIIIDSVKTTSLYYKGYVESKSLGKRDFWLIKFNAKGKPEWDKTFGGYMQEVANSVVQTKDSGYVVCGYTTSLGQGKKDFWVIKVDNVGEYEWDEVFGGENQDEAHSIIQTMDNGYAVCGYTKSKGKGNSDFWVLKLDYDGYLEWDKTYGAQKRDEANSIIQTEDSGFVVCGYTIPEGIGSHDFWVIKVNSEGKSEWKRSFGDLIVEYASSIIQTNDGGYAICGTKLSEETYFDFFIIKVNYKGETEWEKVVGGTGMEEAKSIVQTNDGGYAVCGYTSSKGGGKKDFWIVRLNEMGEMKWQRMFGGQEHDEAKSIVQTNDNGYVICGYTSSEGHGKKDCLVLKLNSNGEQEWYQVYGSLNNDEAKSIIQTFDGGYIICGYKSFDGKEEEEEIIEEEY